MGRRKTDITYWRKGNPLWLEFRTWAAMKTRCKLEENYAGRGISYDPKWETFLGFLEDMGPKPQEDKRMVLDRIDNNGNYCKENCRWALMDHSNHNKRYPKSKNHNLPRGVTTARSGRFTARIKADNHTYNIGTFDTMEEAHDAYQAMSIEWFGQKGVSA